MPEELPSEESIKKIIPAKKKALKGKTQAKKQYSTISLKTR